MLIKKNKKTVTCANGVCTQVRRADRTQQPERSHFKSSSFILDQSWPISFLYGQRDGGLRGPNATAPGCSEKKKSGKKKKKKKHLWVVNDGCC